jgi:hypothetical protein
MEGNQDNQDNVKQTLAVIQEHSLRDLVDHVNAINYRGINKILKDDIVTIMKGNDSFFLLYYE